MDYLTSKAKNPIVSIGLGDWVPAKTTTPEKVTSTGYYYIDALIAANTAPMLGKKDDAKKYVELAAAIRPHSTRPSTRARASTPTAARRP